MRKIQSWILDRFDLPADVTSKIPRILMVGSSRMHVENHKGIERFSSTELRLRLYQGKLTIIGKELVIRAAYPDEVVVEGRIDEVKFQK